MKNDNIIVEKSLNFAIRIVNLSKHLKTQMNENVLSKQILRSGTSIGANVREAIYGQSKADFTSKMSIALKETAETEYWLELLQRTNYISQIQYKSIMNDCSEIAKIITTIVKNSKS